VHSVETWIDGQLVGGLYGVGIGRMFFGESMFSHRTDASKIALAALVAFCRAHGVPLIDCQQNTGTWPAGGAHEIPRADFEAHLARTRGAAPPQDWTYDLRPVALAGKFTARARPAASLSPPTRTSHAGDPSRRSFRCRSLQFYATAPYPCSYLPDRQARSQVATPSHLIHADAYSGLVAAASGAAACSPTGPTATAAAPACRCGCRWPLPAHAQPAPRRQAQHQTSRRVCCACASCPSTTSSTCATSRGRHSGGGMDHDSVDQYTQFLLQSRVNSRLVEFREPTRRQRPAR
jgi:hypothetical protein